jgi:nitrite reductase/ring-hydroxylating ferredoxin subunit
MAHAPLGASRGRSGQPGRVTAGEFSAPAELTDAGFERVASIADLPVGGLLGVTRSSGRGICLFNAGGRIGAIAELCTHQAFPMAEGMLLPDGTVQCSWHGARFDCATGAVVEGPADEPITVYETRLHAGAIWVGSTR